MKGDDVANPDAASCEQQPEVDVQALLVAQRRLSLILASAGEGIYGLDIEGRTTFVNPAASRMTGYGPDELLGRSQHDLLHHHHADGSPYLLADCPIRASLVDGAVHRVGDEVFWRRDGTWFPVTYVSTPIIEDDTTIGAVVIFSDATERLRAEEYLREAIRASARQAASTAALRELQAALQPRMPELLDPELGVHYLPADDTAPIGGDLYDLQVMADGSLHLAVVDVLGKGVTATKDALAVTHALRLLAMAGVELSEVVAQADHLLAANYPDLVATVVVGRYQPEEGRLQLAGGGHPPALLLSGDQGRFLTGGGCPVGWPEAGSDGVEEVVLAPGDTVLLYTDGLIESRRDILAGMERLRALALKKAALTAPGLARTLVEDILAKAERMDDTLCLVLRRPT